MIVKKFLFDLGNVFFDWNPERILKPIFNDDERMNFLSITFLSLIRYSM